jgi:NitT/TauT family transport system substrate-binding protein/putative hydroxymethylpyrimidine transport system substrate-binding protein
MRRVAASLAAVLCSLAAAGCGDGAEPGAPEGATLVLDFTPNAVHAGLYVAQRRGYLEDAGIELEIRQPSASSDAPKLLEAGRVDLAILDINDLGIALDRGFELTLLAAIVDRPLAAVIATDAVSRPRQLEGRDVGVTGLPSDDAVLDTVVRHDGGNPDEVNRIDVGFNAIAALASGKVDAATAFWNAEGVALRREGIGTREFRVDRYGAPSFPELILATTPAFRRDNHELVDSLLDAIRRGYVETAENPAGALDDLLAEVPELDRGRLEAELDALLPAFPASGLIEGGPLLRGFDRWRAWAAQHGIIEPEVEGLGSPPGGAPGSNSAPD